MRRHAAPGNPLTRREFIQYSALAGAVPLLGCGPSPRPPVDTPPPSRPVTEPDGFDHAQPLAADPAAVVHDAVAFPLPVQAGDAAATAVTLWGYVPDGQARLLQVWRSAGPVLKLAHQSTVTPTDGYLKARVTSLAPDTTYRYAFFTVDGAGQPVARTVVGQVKTAWPSDYRWPLTLAATSCTQWNHRPYTALSLTAQQDIDAFCHLGDLTYCDGATTYARYLEMHRENLADPGYQALLPAAGSYMVWDDHEFANDFNPETLGAAQQQAARDAYFRTTPVEPGPQGQLWRSYTWGRTAELIMLDCRSERRPSTLATGEQVYLGAEQMAFLKDRLLHSPAQFKIVLNSVPIIDFPNTFWANANDRWEGYTHAREELLTFMEQQQVENVWFLTGDFHLGLVARVEQAGYRSRIWEIAGGPGGNQGNPLAGIAMQDPELAEQIFPAAQFLYGRANIAMTLLTFDPFANAVRVRFVDAATQDVLFDRTLTWGG